MMNELAASRTLYRGFLFLVAVIGAALLARELIWVLAELFTAALIAATMAPLCDAFTRSERAMRWRWRPPRALIVIVTYLIVGIIALFIGSVVVSAIAQEVVQLIEQLPELASQARAWLISMSSTYPALGQVNLTGWLSANVDSVVGWLGSVLGGMLGVIDLTFAVLGGALTALFIMFMALYLTVDGARMRDYLLVFFPISRQPLAKRMGHGMTTRLGQWAIGQAMLCVIVGGGAWLGCELIGVPYAALIGLIWAMAEFMPGIGPFLAAAPTIILGFTVSPVTGVLAAIFSLVWSQLENNVITPKVMGNAVEMHPIVILLSLLIGAELLGVVGALLAIPVAATIAVLVDELHSVRLERQLLANGVPETVDGTAAVDAPIVVQS